MNKQTKLLYTDIYQEISEIRGFLEEELRNASESMSSRMFDVAEEMTGKTNMAMRENIYLQNQKALAVSEALFTILNYMEASTQEMEQLNKEISAQIQAEVEK